MSIYISENGFITLTLSAIETYVSYEATGILLGHKTEGDYDKYDYQVESVIPFQLAERTKHSVKPKRRKLIYRAQTHFMKYQIIGEFHTHPDGLPKLSEYDKQYIRDVNNEIEIVVAIRRAKKKKRWRCDRKILSGTIGFFEFEIACWKALPAVFRKIDIHCPHALGLTIEEKVKRKRKRIVLKK